MGKNYSQVVGNFELLHPNRDSDQLGGPDHAKAPFSNNVEVGRASEGVVEKNHHSAKTLECREKSGPTRAQEKGERNGFVEGQCGKAMNGELGETRLQHVIYEEWQKEAAKMEGCSGVKGKLLDWQKEAGRVEDDWQVVKGKKDKKLKDTFAMVLRSQTNGRPNCASNL